MRAPDEQRRPGRNGRRGAERYRAGRCLLAVGGLTGLAVSLAVAGAPAAPSKTIVLSDAGGDTRGPLDLRRASLSRAGDGRLRAVLTFAAQVTPRSMLAAVGPPGSACLRIWTAAKADPAATRPDRLVCVTARSDDELRGGVYSQTGLGLAQRGASASVKLNASGRSLAIRFSQSSLGRPVSFLFAVESTPPGCERVSCIDTVPDGGATRRFKLR